MAILVPSARCYMHTSTSKHGHARLIAAASWALLRVLLVSSRTKTVSSYSKRCRHVSLSSPYSGQAAKVGFRVRHEFSSPPQSFRGGFEHVCELTGSFAKYLCCPCGIKKFRWSRPPVSAVTDPQCHPAVTDSPRFPRSWLNLK